VTFRTGNCGWGPTPSAASRTPTPFATWSDAFPSANNATQATSGNRPTYRTNVVNGKPAVRFAAASGQFFNLPDLMNAQAAGTAFFIAKITADPPAGSASCGPVLGDWGTNGSANVWPYIDGHILEDFGSTTRPDLGDPAVNLADWHIASIVTAFGDWRLYLNGTLFYSSGTNSVAWKSTPLIGKTAEFAAALDGDVPEIVVYSGALATLNRQRVEGYLAWKYGQQAKLPVGHPYKNAAPGFEPGTLTTTGRTTTSASFSWTPSIAGTGAVTEALQRSPDGGTSWSTLPASSASPFTDNGLVPDTAYLFRAAYTDSTPSTVYSNVVAVTTTGFVEYLPANQIGTPGSFGGDPARTKAAVFDGDFYTFFQGPDPGGDWAGIDLGVGKAGQAHEVWYAPAVGDATYDHEARAVGLKIQASNDPTFATGVVTLYTVPADPAPVGREWTKVPVDTGGVPYRCYRALSQPIGYVSLAGLRVFGDPVVSVAQAPAPPMPSPWGGRFPAGERVVTLPTVTTTAAVYYTTDGTTPNNTKTLYTGPFLLAIGGSGTTLKAVAYDPTLSTPYSDVVSVDFYPWGFKPNQVWYDDRGNRIQAQGGDAVYWGGRWWWFGMGSNRWMGAIDVNDHYATNLYSSSDLLNWRFEGAVLPTPYTGAQMYRVHVFYSDADSRWVLWANNFVQGGQWLQQAVSAGPDPRGPWTWLPTTPPGGRPNGHYFNDANRLVTADGTNYIVNRTGDELYGGTAGFDIFALNAARTGPTGTVLNLADNNEAPTPFERQGVHFLACGHSNYYDDSITYHPAYRVCTDPTPLGTWAAQADLFTSDPLGTPYNAQPNMVLVLPGKVDGYLYASDKWFQKSQSPLGQGIWESTQVWLPLTFPTSTTVQAQRPATWDLSYFADAYTPAVLTVTGTGATAAFISWVNASGSSGITHQLQRRSTVYADWEDVGGATASPVTDTGLLPNRAYDYQVKATNGAGVVVYSQPVTAVTLKAGPFPWFQPDLVGGTCGLAV
jgi:hypothetical protein